MENQKLPYSEVMDDMGLPNDSCRIELVNTLKMFAEHCFAASVQNGYETGQQMDGHINWRTFNPALFFKIHLTYYHHPELWLVITGFEKLTMEEYLHSINEKHEGTRIVNPDSELAQNNEKANEN